MSALIQIQQMEKLERLISGSPIVLVEFGSRQCAPCHALREKISAYLSEASCVKGAYVETDDHPEVAGHYGILSAPAIRLVPE